jgi:calmodulin
MARKVTDADGGVGLVMDSFKVFDKDNNGKVSVSELKHVMTKMGESLTNAEVEGILKEAEIDSDGNINYEDFVNHLVGAYELFQQ